MNKTMEYQTNGQPVCIDFEDLKNKLGYRTFKPRIGSLGRAMLKAVKEQHHGSIGWLKHQLDELFKKQRHNNNDNYKKGKRFNAHNSK